MDGVDFDLLRIDINVDLQRLQADVTVERIEPIPEYTDAFRLHYTDHEGGDGCAALIGMMITNLEYGSYEERHIWTMDIAEALSIVCQRKEAAP